MKQSEQSVIEGCKRGERAAYEEFFTLYSHVILQGLRSKIFSPDMVEETYSLVVIKIYAGMKSYRAELKYEVSSWVYRIAQNTAIDLFRRSEVKPLSLDAFGDDENRENADDIGISGEAESAYETFIREEDGRRVLVAIDALPKPFGETIRRVCAEGMTYAEAGRVMDCPENTIRSRVHRGKKMFRGYLELEEKRANII